MKNEDFYLTPFKVVSGLLVSLVEVVRLLDREGECGPAVVAGVALQVVDDGGQQVGLLRLGAGGVVGHVGEVDVQVVERRLVVEVHAELGRGDAVLG